MHFTTKNLVVQVVVNVRVTLGHLVLRERRHWDEPLARLESLGLLLPEQILDGFHLPTLQQNSIDGLVAGH